MFGTENLLRSNTSPRPDTTQANHDRSAFEPFAQQGETVRNSEVAAHEGSKGYCWNVFLHGPKQERPGIALPGIALLACALSACGGSVAPTTESADSKASTKKVLSASAYSQLGVQNANRLTLLLTGHQGAADAYCGTGTSDQSCYPALNPDNGAQWVTLGSDRSWMQLDYDVCDGVNYGGPTPKCVAYIGHVGVKFTPASTTLNGVEGGSATLSPYQAGKPLSLTFSASTPASSYPASPIQYSTLPYRGVNLAGAEYDYAFQLPSIADGAYYAERGMNTIRLPFKWEYLQSSSSNPGDRANDPSIPVDFRSPKGKAYADLVNRYLGKGMTVIVDMHNYMRYGADNTIIGSNVPGAPTATQYAAAWSAIAAQFRNQPQVVFDLMNEPHEMSTRTIVDNYNAAIQTIRDAGAKNLILLEGNGWSGAYSWTNPSTDTDVPPMANAQAFTPDAIHDPGNNFAINVHQYFDADNSGTQPDCVANYRPDISGLNGYLNQFRLKAIVTELGGPNTGTCAADINAFLSALPQEQYLGWTGWAGGANSKGLSTYFGPLGQGETVTISLGFQPNLNLPASR
ncbi:glycoside hydrolase family 5 protein [Caballeronia mineralivorans]|uniref:glycoside hydrolase family 5 protein n=1 Tax=Caballeronia mineralivorans TaxID=2010198 RepID=UPI00069F3BE5|nr:glycoside hydrolase family 5 protein [Caballeronia mineralivorans]